MAVDDPIGEMRLRYGFWVVVVGLVVSLVAVLAALWRLSDPTSITGIVASLTGIVGTVVGAFFGVHVGAAGKEKAEAERREAQHTVTRMAAAMTPEQAASVIGPKVP
jgi:hypothetical protein